MIQYHRTAFGLGTLFRIQGSAIYRACFAGFFSVFVFALVRAYWDEPDNEDSNDELRHPYSIGILVAALTFLLVFRAQAAYARYWEACSAVHHMMSKWMDATTHTAIYHLQCDHYKDIKPPVFFDYPELNAHFLSREREHRHIDSTDNYFDADRISQRATSKSIEPINIRDEKVRHSAALGKGQRKRKTHRRNDSAESEYSSGKDQVLLPLPLEGEPKLDGNWGALFDDGKATYADPQNPNETSIPAGGFASTQGGRSPPLFLQELAHLCSLMCGVALATLRNDIEGSESPLDIYKPGSEWPQVDPVKMKGEHAFGWSYWTKFLIFLGFGRSAEDRTRYNASRPMPVIGGISEGEVRFLQMARGPYAKTQLCWQWLSEFIIREHLAGSTGAVGPPIISRIIQFLGDGMIYYNHARKIMFIPFPFPHAQLTAIYILVAIPAVAFLMDQYTEDAWVGAVLTFLTVTALSGIHEVARELENPFRNVPNEIPLVTLQAQFNEALVTMYAGYHPDHFWKESGDYFKNAKPTGATMDSDSSISTNGQPPADVEIKSTPQRKNPVAKPPTGRGESQIAGLEAQVHLMLQKIEAQERELAQLRMRVGEDDEKKSGHA